MKLFHMHIIAYSTIFHGDLLAIYNKGDSIITFSMKKYINLPIFIVLNQTMLKFLEILYTNIHFNNIYIQYIDTITIFKDESSNPTIDIMMSFSGNILEFIAVRLSVPYFEGCRPKTRACHLLWVQLKNIS